MSSRGSHEPGNVRGEYKTAISPEKARDLLAFVDEFSRAQRRSYGGPSTMRTSEAWRVFVARWQTRALLLVEEGEAE